MKENSTLIVVVLDRSGSMETIRKDMEGGFNQFIKEQSEVPGECRVSLFQFDTGLPEVVYSYKDVREVQPLRIVPRGSTALLDAIGHTVDTVGIKLASMPEAERPSKVAVVIITDGQENASSIYDLEQVRSKIEHQRAKYSWEFVFLGADESAISVANSYGIASAAAYTADAGGSRALFASVGSSLKSYRGGQGFTYDQQSYNLAVDADDNS